MHHFRPTWSILRARRRIDLLAVVPLAFVLFAVSATFWPPRSGPAGLVLVVELQLLIILLVGLAPVALVGRSRALGLGLVAVLAFGLVRFGPEWVSVPANGPADLSVMSWNLEVGSRPAAATVAALGASNADVLALQELDHEPSAAIEADPVLLERYPYRSLVPGGVIGVGLLSRYPIDVVDSSFDPPLLEAVVHAPRGDVHVIDAHPLPPWPIRLNPLALTYDTAFRDTKIAEIRRRADAALARGERVLVAGDFNTTPTEAAYRTLATGLRDAHVEAGQGPGWTWRPGPLEFLGMGFLRIDLQLAGGALEPVSSWTDCSVAGDHCRLHGGYRLD